jgi:hypothetical protein
VADAAAGTKIRADRHDAEDNGFRDGLTNCITKDGQTTVTQNIPMSNKRITGLADPVNPQDAATRGYAVAKAGDTMTGTLNINGGNLVVSTGGFSLGGNAFMTDTSVSLLRLSGDPTGHFIGYDGTSMVLHGGTGSGVYGINFQNGTATVSWGSIGPTGMRINGDLAVSGRIDASGPITSAGVPVTLKSDFDALLARIEALESRTP